MDEAITSYIKKKNRIFSYTEIEEINVPDHALLYLKDYTRGADRLFGKSHIFQLSFLAQAA